MEKPHMRSVERLLQNKRGKIVVAHVAPAVRIAISEGFEKKKNSCAGVFCFIVFHGQEFSMEPGTVSTGKVVTALKNIGFDYVFDTNFAADVTIVEEASEFVSRLTKGTGVLPMLT